MENRYAQPVTLLAPSENRVGTGADLHVLPSTKPAKLYQHAARYCFRGMTVPIMKDLIAHRKIKLPNGIPTLESDVCRVLVWDALPKTIEEEFSEFWKHRHPSKAPRFHSQITEEALDCFHGTIDEDVIEDAKDSLK